MKRRILTLALILVSSVISFAQGNLKVAWDDYKLSFGLPYPADTGYEIDEFGTFYVYSEAVPLSMTVVTEIDGTKLTAANYQEVFAKSTNGKDIKGTLLDNGIYAISFNWGDPSEPKIAFIYKVNDKQYVSCGINDDNGKYMDVFKKISIAKK